ncbi:MAG TPA: adenylosuccinate lyase [Thermoflexales bacterium]|nr:adenylosuccinate lyase [Thermoflexales bacterium]
MSHDTFQSPFTTRYGSPAMRQIWSERNKRLMWRKMWLALAQSQQKMGLLTAAQLADIEAHAGEVNEASINRALAIEAEIHHDLMAELKAFAEQCPIGGGALHLGATSMDIEDNADALRLRDALSLINQKLGELLRVLAAQVDGYADLPVMAFTHLQPAEPTTLGYRLAFYLQDLLMDANALDGATAALRGKGFRGAVGTSAGYLELTEDGRPKTDSPVSLLLSSVSLSEFDVVNQTAPRKQEWHIVNALAGLAGSLYKFAFDLRILQMPPVGEMAEPFGANQVGSSAMPFKRNPINAEKIDSLARYLATLPRVMWDNAAHSLLERTLDDSANRRVVLAEAFLCADELLITATRIIKNMRVNTAQIERNMQTYGPFAATERLLMALAKAGADRQAMHEVIRKHSMAAWAAIGAGQPNPLIELLLADAEIGRWVAPERARALLDASAYVGDAPIRARALANKVLKGEG